MTEQIFRFTQQEADELALAYIMEHSTRGDNPKKRQRIQREVLRTKNLVHHCVDLRALVGTFSEFEIQGNALRLGSCALESRLFERYRPEDIRRVHLMIASAGDYEIDRDPISDVYADLWGTGYIDAVVDLVRDRLAETQEDEDFYLTRPFGPGFFGLTLQEVRKFFALLPAERIGVTLRDHLMVPLKSYAGIMLELRRGLTLQQRDCVSCIGNEFGCSYCRNNHTAG